MKLESQVTSLEISKRLKELGVKQESFFHWCGLKNYNIQYGNFVYMGDVVSAFTVAELGEMLPRGFRSGRCSPKFQRKKGAYKAYNWHDGYGTLEKIDKDFFADTEADARGKMLIYLLENNLTSLS